MWRSILVSSLLFLGASISAIAQSETVASRPKKLQQLYLSIGGGPAFTLNKEARTRGIAFTSDISLALRQQRIFRLGFQISGFTSKDAPKPDLILDNTGFDHSLVSPSVSIGKRKKINEKLQIQGLAGASLNLHSYLPYISEEAAAAGTEACIPAFLVKPGLILRAEAMALPVRFAGLTIGAFYHYVPGISNGGVTLSLNFGLIKRKELL
ncbi:hypothetical protein [Adhaeribacter soli]|uniref:Outer membrane beta-barrel protein n=1 Tax=Adhaeribacter soli TaxID=2607655 RepID=A0A5N1IX94_9BACT|nr:hypothetical protein [Adhaeribacter soli]KAA9338871.1 hypothetical protein F0P94_08740 [Adhaeribacter soli]